MESIVTNKPICMKKRRGKKYRGKKERGREKPYCFLYGILKEKHKLLVVLIDTKVEGGGGHNYK